MKRCVLAKNAAPILLFSLLFSLYASVAAAQEDGNQEPLFYTRYDAVGFTGDSPPQYTVTTNTGFDRLKVRLVRSDGRVFTKEEKDVGPQNDVTITLKQPPGTFKYKAEISGVLAETSEPMEPVKESFSVVLAEPLDIDIDGDDADLGANHMKIKLNRHPEKITLWLYDDQNNQMSEINIDTSGGKGKTVDLSWPAQEKEVASIKIRATDQYQLWTEGLIEPFWVEIPHKSIDFDTNKSSFKDSEAEKLREVANTINSFLNNNRMTHGPKLQLYIVGYTDTVGDRESNLKLSRERAKSVGKWLVRNGLKIPVYFQGFGEDVLVKKTADNTEEAANRRVLILLGSSKPATSSYIPKRNWVKIR